ncbi:MAG: AMP-binding protein [Betaproteobacteria bacterium]|nr:AMP-binding protein [Betaproteobacteria bacterium]
MAEKSLFHALVKARRRFGKDASAQWQDQTPKSSSYAEVLRMTLILGRLSTNVTDRDEHVGVLLPNVITTLCVLIGLSAFRRVPCMLNYTAGSETMQNACEAACVRRVFTSRAFLDKAGLHETVAALHGVRMVYLEDLVGALNRWDKIWLAQALLHPGSAVPRANPEAPAVVIFTSGSEGRPKGVVLSHRALLANVEQILSYLPIGPEEKVFNCLPLFHSFGLTAGALLPMISGARLALYPSPLHYKEIPRLLRETGATVLFGTSTFLKNYAKNGAAEEFSALKYVVAGAEKLSEEVRRTWREQFGIDILEGYGATETAPVLSINRPQDNRPGTVGKLLPGINAMVRPVPGIPRGGSLHVHGPNLLSGYYLADAPGVLHMPKSDLGPGWYDTGDVVELDAHGYLMLQARLKRFAKVAGEMVSLEISEAIARAASPDFDHAAACVPDSGRGEAIILLTTDRGLTRERLIQMAKTLRQPEIAVARRLRVVESLPILGTGKIDYVGLARLAEGA